MEFKKLGELMEGQRQRVTLAEETETRYKNLQQLGYISQDQFLERQSDLLDQRMRLQTLQRDQINLQRQITDQQSLIDTTPIKYKNQIAEIDRAISSGEQEQSQSEAQREWVVLAPETGTATAVIGEVGQSVDPNRALIAVVPEGAKLQAQLYAPSRSIGFVRPGDSVYLRYQAYPYQKFGHYLGTVDSVSKATLSASELGGANPSAAANSGASGSNEPLYRLTVNLAQQTVNAYGLQHVLQAGMLVDADVLQETRYLYEWVLEPLTTLTGKIH
jgi:membrane fusion protein